MTGMWWDGGMGFVCSQEATAVQEILETRIQLCGICCSDNWLAASQIRQSSRFRGA